LNFDHLYFTQGIEAVPGVEAIVLGILTTPQLHWMVRATNLHVGASEEDYYTTISKGFRLNHQSFSLYQSGFEELSLCSFSFFFVPNVFTSLCHQLTFFVFIFQASVGFETIEEYISFYRQGVYYRWSQWGWCNQTPRIAEIYSRAEAGNQEFWHGGQWVTE
jgi:hypothetical protein